MNTAPVPRARALGLCTLLLLTIACTLLPWLAPSAGPSDIELTNEAVLATNAAIEAAILATETAEAGAPALTSTPTPDPCTGWWCTVRGVVYVEEAAPGNELEGASVMLDQFSYCSPTSEQYETTTGHDGTFEFGEVFFHDTDRIWIKVEAKGYEPTVWDSTGHYCLFCSCFGSPIEIVLHTAPGQ